MYIIEATVPVGSLERLGEYQDLTYAIEPHARLETVARFYTESRAELLRLLRADDQVINAEIFYLT